MTWRRAISQQCHRSFHTHRSLRTSSSAKDLPLIDIREATFYRQYPSKQLTGSSSGSLSISINPALFKGLTYSLPSSTHKTKDSQYWAVISDSSSARTTILQVLAAQHVCLPPLARKYPFLAERSLSPHEAIKYVGFDAERGSAVGGTHVLGSYLSSRYESRREVTDFSLRNYLLGLTELNALERETGEDEQKLLEDVIEQLNLKPLLDMPVSNLSNGQTRRARIAKALMSQPELLLLDGPFMGLDPLTARKMDGVLRRLAESHTPRVILSLRPEDEIPHWVSHVLTVDESFNVISQGPVNREKSTTAKQTESTNQALQNRQQFSRDGVPRKQSAPKLGEPLIEMMGVKVSYGDKTVLGNWTQPEMQDVDEPKTGLWWSLRRGQRCGIFGPNGSGKTTMLSLITSDHPQTYSLPIKLFGRSRLPKPGQPGISIFDLQQRMGHSSPEIHAFFPKTLTVRRTLESAWADAPLARPKLTSEKDRRVDAFLRWFLRELHPSVVGETKIEALEQLSPTAGMARKRILDSIVDSDSEDLLWADTIRFAELNFSSQRLILFLRALIHQPDLIILDEALSGVDEATRDKALLFLSHGENATVVSTKLQDSALKQMGSVTFEGLTAEQALLVISHSPTDVPGCVREWICLPDPDDKGAPPRQGVLKAPLEMEPQGWNAIWGAVVEK